MCLYFLTVAHLRILSGYAMNATLPHGLALIDMCLDKTFSEEKPYGQQSYTHRNG